MKRLQNKGFSLIELIIVIAIMAILVGVLVPTFIKYVGKTRRTIDVNNAAEYVKACQTSQVFNEYASPSEEEYYQGYDPTEEELSGIWTCGFRAGDDSVNLDNPSSFLDYFCAEVGCVPVSKTNPNYYWYVKYNRYTMSILEIFLVDGNTNSLYEVYPNGKDFIENGP